MNGTILRQSGTRYKRKITECETGLSPHPYLKEDGHFSFIYWGMTGWHLWANYKEEKWKEAISKPELGAAFFSEWICFRNVEVRQWN